MRLKKIQKAAFELTNYEQLDKWINLLGHWSFYIFLRGVELYEIEQANHKRAPNSKTILGVCRLVIPRGLFPDNCHFIWNQHFFVFFKRLEYSSWRIKLEIFLNLEKFFRLSFCEFLCELGISGRQNFFDSSSYSIE